MSGSELGFENEGRWGILIGVADVPHIGPEERKRLEGTYQNFEKSARLRGVPSLGSGAIFPIDESDILVRPFEIPPWLRFAYGMDVGWNVTCGIFGAYDAEGDILYLIGEHYRSTAEPSVHAAAIRARAGGWMPGCIDPASKGRSQVDGRQLLELYQQLGLRLTPADNGLEAGIYKCWERLSTGRLKVFSNLQNWLAEYRVYRRDERGRVVAVMNHAMDATRYLVASGIDIAAQKPSAQRPGKSQHQYQYDSAAEMWRRR
jgi:hypothetical protein